MALRGTLTHWKTRTLAAKLGIPPCYALGLLEALWHTTAELAPSGNIGRLPDAAIAMEMFYEGDASAMIAALVESGHLDAHPLHRLIVHDWAIHADYNTKRKLQRRKEVIFANDGNGLEPVTRHDPSMTRHAPSQPGMTPHESIPEPEPEPEPVLPSGEKHGAAAPPRPGAVARRGEETEKTRLATENGSQGASRRSGKGMAGKGQRNSLNLGRQAHNVVSDSVMRRSKWLLAHVQEFWVRLNVPRLREKGSLSAGDLALCPWSRRDQEAAIDLLYSFPKLDEGTLRTCLQHRSLSVELGYFNASVQPSKWLRDLPSFLAGPLTRYNESVPKVNGKYQKSRN